VTTGESNELIGVVGNFGQIAECGQIECVGAMHIYWLRIKGL